MHNMENGAVLDCGTVCSGRHLDTSVMMGPADPPKMMVGAAGRIGTSETVGLVLGGGEGHKVVHGYFRDKWRCLGFNAPENPKVVGWYPLVRIGGHND